MKKKRIKDLPFSQRPQEKLLLKGPTALTNEELLAILLGSGSRNHNAVGLAQMLLKKFPFKTLPQSFPTLQDLKGIGKTKSARIAAALEVGERLFGQEVLARIYIHSTKDILVQVKEITQKKQEQLVVLYLNARQELIQKEIVALGNINVLAIELREVLAPALLSSCVSIVVAHNHPSGDPRPSDADITFTQKLHEACQLVGLILVDHVVVSAHRYFSFAEGDSFM